MPTRCYRDHAPVSPPPNHTTPEGEDSIRSFSPPTQPQAHVWPPQLPLARALAAGRPRRSGSACAPSFRRDGRARRLAGCFRRPGLARGRGESNVPAALGAMTLEEQSPALRDEDPRVGAVTGPLAEAAIAPRRRLSRPTWWCATMRSSAGSLAAERLSVPRATANGGPFFSFRQKRCCTSSSRGSRRLRAQVDAPADPSLATLHRYLNIVTVPPGLLAAADFIPPVTHHVRPELDDVTGDTPPPGGSPPSPRGRRCTPRSAPCSTACRDFRRHPRRAARRADQPHPHSRSRIETLPAFGPQGGQLRVEPDVPAGASSYRGATRSGAARAGMNTVHRARSTTRSRSSSPADGRPAPECAAVRGGRVGCGSRRNRHCRTRSGRR